MYKLRSQIPQMFMVVLLASCATSNHKPYRDYIQKSPDWTADKEIFYGMDAEEALATAFAPLGPGLRYRNKIEKVYDFVGVDWVERTLPVDNLYGSENLRLIITKQRCISAMNNVMIQNLAYYLISESQLNAFGHSYYEKGCRVQQAMQSAYVPEFRYLVDELEEEIMR